MEKKKKFQIPTTCALLFMLMIVCAVLTWIIPAGAYETEKVGNLNKVIAGTYHRQYSSGSLGRSHGSYGRLLQVSQADLHDHVLRRRRCGT